MPRDTERHDREAELWSYLNSLQAQIDRLMATDEARTERIEKLEKDRQILRDRLRSAKEQLARRKFLSRRRVDDPPTSGSSTSPVKPTETDPGVEVPGIGTIKSAPTATTGPRRAIKVATILDPFSAVGFDPEFRSLPLSARSWTGTIENERPDLLLVESAYRGVDGSWATRVARFGSPSEYLADLVSWCRTRGIPTVFWNKEDPVNFDWFIQSASLFDFVFTVDGDQIGRYRKSLGHDRVDLLQFFAQPAIHFPPGSGDRPGSVAFAGSYYADKHPQRRLQIETVVDPAREFGLHIFDRHGARPDSRFAWPDRYRPHIMGSLSYLQTVEAYRRYKVFLNVNTVTDSPTMCARRVFELAACGTPVISGESAALSGSGAPVWEVHSAAEAEDALRDLLTNKSRREEMSEALRSWVSDGHTASDRVDSILDFVGLT